MNRSGQASAPQTVPTCAAVGRPSRPLISKDAGRITAFTARGTLSVRNIADCANVLDTNIEGAKGDFSWNGRYIAYHAWKSTKSGFEVQVVDLERRRFAAITDLPGQSYFPSWTADGRLSFRYDSAEFRGFMIAERVLDQPWHALPQPAVRPARVTWEQLFDSPRPRTRVTIVIVWAPWSAHAADALTAQAQAAKTAHASGLDVSFAAVVEPAARISDALHTLESHGVDVPRARFVTPTAFELTGGPNQIPSNLLFGNGTLVEVRLGAQNAAALIHWARSYAASPAASP